MEQAAELAGPPSCGDIWSRCSKIGSGFPIFRYDPEKGTAESAADIVPDLTYEQRRRLDRRLSYTGRSMGAETVQASGPLGTLPVLRDRKFWNDDVFTGPFASEALLDSGIRPGLAADAAVITSADVDSLLYASERLHTAVPRDVLATVNRKGSAIFEGFAITQYEIPRYLWYATRMGKHTAPPGSLDQSLQPLPVYLAQRERVLITRRTGAVRALAPTYVP